ncbi:telomeric repeat binding factor 1, putative [Plasmodium ovale]|uniref:Telomeric repeat binding factor 1, putative n=1 Tax=Plasmodium ovale TaxID=36330 RepID=A0A1D3U7X5_PLAOA|nr:telomeric repeat binding factor 1, putative [Plasmodium ovale]
MDLQLLKIKSSIVVDENSSPVWIDKKEIEKANIAPEKKKGRYKTRVKWNKRETQLLIDGINTYGLSNWSKILQSYDFPKHRTSVSLKDKYRNFKKVFIMEKD